MVSFVMFIFILKGASALSNLVWISSLDGKYRNHSYWFDSDSSMTAFEADDHCALNNGRLAPFIDSYQYNFLLGLRPETSVDTFIGTMDLAEENTWVNFDGSSIPGNEFLYTMTDYPNHQPNGGTTQNCAVINSRVWVSTVYVDSQTQDKACTHTTTDMLCYREDWSGLCLSWNSTADFEYRQHCYWLTSKTPIGTSWSVVDSMNKCQCEGGQLAPVIDDFQYAFIHNLLTSIAGATGTTLGVWLGPHNIKGSPMNWNGDPVKASNLTSAPEGEYCLLISAAGVQTWRLCSYSDTSIVIGALCYKEGGSSHGTDTTASSTTTSIEEIKNELYVNPRETTAFKMTKISVYEDRPVAKGIGMVGVAVLASVFVFIIILDCQRIEQYCSKRKP
ncbi:uncharacterized protein LOC125657482 isoform X3 [Ostrea edulis]|uniref:uncharacterized protein LOC125657482 isoform X3 n=1 Tax=Ostrea edulis TaxID=37623 RepID=UPI0024AFBDDD|nr:uncharacterized protein LOC125657482 isoform X3 [Ostrea edulis]